MLRCQVNENLGIDIFYHEGRNPLYRAFQGFGQAKFAYGGLIWLEPIYTTTPAASKKMDSKIIISLP